MLNIEPIEVVQRLIVLVFAAILTSWSWLLWSLFTGQPILPENPLVSRRAVPWHLGTILLAFVLYASVSLFVTASYPGCRRSNAGKGWADTLVPF